MTALVWLAGNKGPVIVNPDKARDTVEPIRDDAPAELNQAPEWNQLTLDSSPELYGLRHRQMSGDVHASEQYVPPFQTVDVNHNKIIDDQVSTAGTAAAREAAGIFGHGTAEYTVDIEPLPLDRPFGNDYFGANSPEIQKGAGQYMGSPVPDIDWQGVAQARGVQQSRAAYRGSYDQLLTGAPGA